MRHKTLMAALLAVAASTAVEEWLPFSILTPAKAQAPADPVPAPAPDPAPEMPPALAPEQAPVPAEPPSVELAPPPAPLPSATPAPTTPPPPPPLPFVVPPTEFVAPDQGEFAPLLQVVPAHRLAMMEAGRPLPETDPLVARSAVVLAQMTGKFLEDAPRIVELTIKTCAAIRLAKATASPLELLDGALNSKRPASAKANGSRPRQFDKFASGYLKARLEGGKDHAAAMTEIQGVPATPPAAPR